VKTNSSLSRRDFLKLIALASILPAANLADRVASVSDAHTPGVIVIVLDALSALNLSLYGYSRRTSPNIERFAGRSTVYHAHYSTANFTSSGTASLLTGTYPWTHRAFHYEGLVAADKVEANVFRYWNDSGLCLGFTQNAWADLLLDQFSPWLDTHLDLREFSLDKSFFHRPLFSNDPIASFRGLNSYALELEPGWSAASLLALARKTRLFLRKKDLDQRFQLEYPLGIPQTLNDADTFFLLADVFDGLMNLVSHLPPAALAYLHLYPPHYPYAPSREFMDAFRGGWQPIVKPPAHFLDSVSKEIQAVIRDTREQYDAYIASVDDEFGRLIDFMEQEGIFHRNYVVLTSDHGELYERGVMGHVNPYLYEPLVRVPLVISSPDQTVRVDIHTPTSSVDLVPTLLFLTGRSVPAACEGVLLPGLGGTEDSQRSIFSLDTKSTHVRGVIEKATVSLRKGQYKLIAYLGHHGLEDEFELFDAQNDPEEMSNLTNVAHGIFRDLRNEIETKLRQINEPFLLK